jgi:hypothetical protein
MGPLPDAVVVGNAARRVSQMLKLGEDTPLFDTAEAGVLELNRLIESEEASRDYSPEGGFFEACAWFEDYQDATDVATHFKDAGYVTGWENVRRTNVPQDPDTGGGSWAMMVWVRWLS